MKDATQEQYIKMTQTPVHKLVLTLAVPTIISMLVTNIYSIADTYFVSGLGTSPSGATGVVFGLMAIIQAFGFMFGHGAGSNISRKLGDHHIEDARKFASTSFYLALSFGCLIMVLGLLFQVPLARLLGSTDSILPYALTYARFILLAAPAMTTSCVMNNILRYEGRAFYSMIGLTSGGIINIFGDYILIRHVHMGIAGAGISTAVSQYISMIILLCPFLAGKVQSHFSPRYFSHQWKDICNILAVGFPSLTRQGLNSISVMSLNLCAAVYGDSAIAAMSIVARVMNFLFCVGLGLGQGFQPVSAFNFGAKEYSRVKEACRFTTLFSLGLMVIMAVLGFLFAKPIVTAFRDDEDVIRVGALAMRFQCITLLCIPISTSGNMLFQSIGKSGRAILLASARSGLFFIPLLFILSRTLGLLGIQLAQPAADILSAAITLPMILQYLNTLPKDGESIPS